jgi:hypothetical protein
MSWDQSKTRIAEKYAGKDPSLVRRRSGFGARGPSLTVAIPKVGMHLPPSSYIKLLENLQDNAATMASDIMDEMRKELSRPLVLTSTTQLVNMNPSHLACKSHTTYNWRRRKIKQLVTTIPS